MLSARETRCAKSRGKLHGAEGGLNFGRRSSIAGTRDGTVEFPVAPANNYSGTGRAKISPSETVAARLAFALFAGFSSGRPGFPRRKNCSRAGAGLFPTGNKAGNDRQVSIRVSESCLP